MSRLLSQQRAAFALQKIQGFSDPPRNRNNEGKQEKMSTHLHKTPIRILSNGLGQALAFLLSDNGSEIGVKRKESGQLYDWLCEWLCGNADENQPCRVYPAGDLIAQLMAGDRRDYLRAQEETLLLFDWLAKFADAYLEESQDAPAQ